MSTYDKAIKGAYNVTFSGSVTAKERRMLTKAKIDEFKNDLFLEFGVKGNPKAESCFALAWDYGHQKGYTEVYGYFLELVELIK